MVACACVYRLEERELVLLPVPHLCFHFFVLLSLPSHTSLPPTHPTSPTSTSLSRKINFYNLFSILNNFKKNLILPTVLFSLWFQEPFRAIQFSTPILWRVHHHTLRAGTKFNILPLEKKKTLKTSVFCLHTQWF